jgi:two-component system, OmpR family, sensor histidine kinase ChvG
MKAVRKVALIGAGILCFSLAALSIIVTAAMILIMSQVEAGLIDARVQTLLAQGEIIAMAIASQGTDSDAIDIDPERLLELQAGEPMVPLTHFSASSIPSTPSWHLCCGG